MTTKQLIYVHEYSKAFGLKNTKDFIINDKLLYNISFIEIFLK
jgi:hypothetical protein